MIALPMIAAGRGRRVFLQTGMIELGLVLAATVICWPLISESIWNWTSDGMVLLPFIGLFIFPFTIGAIILSEKETEARSMANLCRRCGYDLRESPDRCPECGTLVKTDPDRF